MSTGTYFIRSCPTCGRTLEVRVTLLGREVECVHCGANFLACEQPEHDDARVEQVLARAQRYIESLGMASNKTELPAAAPIEDANLDSTTIDPTTTEAL